MCEKILRNKMQIIFKGRPQTTNTLYRRHGHIIYMTTSGKKMKESYSAQLRDQYKKPPKKGELDVRLELFFDDKRVRDIDNYNKIVLDSCKGILWDDDSQIMSLLIIKNYDKNDPRIEMEIN